MDHSQVVLNAVVNQNSPDNNVRKNAEIQFNHMCGQDPSSVIYILNQLSLNEQLPIDLRQSCLLHLRRMVPKYWSLAFQSFIGPPINQELKQVVRQSSIQLATSTDNSKLRSGSSYVIVQIAAADYPDEWPDLLNQLFLLTTNNDNRNAMIGGLTVLNDLFDDLISEDQFWEGGVGGELTNHIIKLLNNENIESDIKTTCIKLYQSILNVLQSPESFTSELRKNSVYQHVTSSVDLFVSLLDKSIATSISTADNPLILSDIYFRTYIYKTLNSFLGSFNKRIKLTVKQSIMGLILKDFKYVSKYYKSVVVLEDNNSAIVTTPDLLLPSDAISNLIIELLLAGSVLQHDIHISDNLDALHAFIQDLVECSILPKETIQQYEADFNIYVTDITGLSSTATVRESVNELLSELNDQDASLVFNLITQYMTSADNSKWELKECYLYLFESLLMNEDTKNLGKHSSLPDLLNIATAFISYKNSNQNHHLVTSRCFLLLPKFFSKFEDALSVDSFGIKAFVDMIKFTSNHNDNDDDLFALVKVSVLVSCTFYKQLLNFERSLDFSTIQEVQLAIFQITLTLVEESEDDSLPALLEAITVGIDLCNENASRVIVSDETSVIGLIFKISFQDSANLQLTVDSSECLRALLANITINDYMASCEKSLPFILTIIQNSLSTGKVEYSPDLDLALELFSVIIDSSPANTEFPNEIFNFTFPVLNKLILISTDDQILQSAGQVFNNILQKASKSFIDYTDPETKKSGMDLLLTIVSKFLSPDLSDSAAMDCGSIVLSLINKFQTYLSNDFLTQILEATVRRLISAKEVITIENLIMVFCNLVLTSSSDMINFLSNNIKLEDPKTGETKSGLSLVLPIWFQSFEITRGYEKIKQNTLALGKIFTLNSESVQSLIVDGDIIPYQGDLIRTRSMTKAMPDQYTQIPAPQKILKLLISELNFQCQQPNANDYLPEAEEDVEDNGDDEGWEDMDDIGVPNFEKLKSYVDSDNDEEYDDQKGNDDLKIILVQFFKECTAKNLGNFQKYYELLDDDEKKTLTENIAF
mmetsp:Transcript_5054/g.6344  ORF Transcript_5054/g.6344 Transcript_5054/m.6344 type:complete len:1048 (-) Transcript_5054:85-3228(-)